MARKGLRRSACVGNPAIHRQWGAWCHPDTPDRGEIVDKCFNFLADRKIAFLDVYAVNPIMGWRSDTKVRDAHSPEVSGQRFNVSVIMRRRVGS